MTVVTSNVREGNDIVLTNRIVMADGDALQLVNLAGDISVRVFDMSAAGEGRTPNTAIFTKTDIDKHTGGPDDGACVFNTYQTKYWDGKGGTGYNFAYQIEWDSAGTTGPYLRAGHTYHVKFEFDGDNTGTDDFGIVRWMHVLKMAPGDPS